MLLENDSRFTYIFKALRTIIESIEKARKNSFVTFLKIRKGEDFESISAAFPLEV